MQSYGQFDVFPLSDNLPIWRERDQAGVLGVASRKEKLHVVRREGDLYCIRVPGVGYGYVRAEDVVAERDARLQQGGSHPAFAGAHPMARRAPYPNGAFPGDAYSGFAPVGFLERLIAYLADFIILFVIYYFLAVLLDVQRPGIYAEPMVVNGVETKRYVFTFWAGGGVGAVVSFVAGITYWIGGWAAFGATPGKMLLGQRIVHAQTGGRIGIRASVIRYLGTIVSALPLFLGYLWVIWDGDKQAWHDKFANTRVVRR